MNLHLLELLPEELTTHLCGLGLPAQEGDARRMLASLWERGVPQAKRPVRREIQEVVLGMDYHRPQVVQRVEDPDDHSVRYLFAADDGAVFEVVRIPLERPGCFSLCLSSQIGCAMRCAFCATGKLGLSRNLRPAEILGSFLTVRDEAPGRVTGAVFMGQGEPFHNYDAVIRSAKLLCHPCGGRISAENISISTVGLVPAIHRFAEEHHPFRLVISLTSAVAQRRESLLPVATKWSLEELADAVRAYARSCRTRVTIAWVLMGGINHDEEEVEALKSLLSDVPIRLNLIDVNSNGDFRRATHEELNQFRDQLQALGVPIVRRYSVGRGQNAACGMLARVFQGHPPAN
jgi:23S rRNA (adenine2503-C2)-methyltransferase